MYGAQKEQEDNMFTDPSAYASIRYPNTALLVGAAATMEQPLRSMASPLSEGNHQPIGTELLRQRQNIRRYLWQQVRFQTNFLHFKEGPTRNTTFCMFY